MDSLSIFSLNCWLFQRPISTDNNLRTEKVLRLIKERDPDLVTLQEVWSNKYLRKIKEALPGYHTISSGSPFLNQSGLLMLTKAKPLSSKVHFFNLSLNHNPTEWLLRKGYIVARIAIGNSEVTIVDTHLYAPFSKAAADIPEKQLDELVETLPSGNVILCGDLNLDEQKVAEICDGRLTRLCDNTTTYDAKSPYRSTRFNRFMSDKDKKIDYILSSGTSLRGIDYTVIKTPFVSDHCPIFCRIDLS